MSASVFRDLQYMVILRVGFDALSFDRLTIGKAKQFHIGLYHSKGNSKCTKEALLH